MKSRYLKVLALYTFSTAIPTMLFRTQRVSHHTVKWLLRNATGYAIFAYGLHVLSQRKHTS